MMEGAGCQMQGGSGGATCHLNCGGAVAQGGLGHPAAHAAPAAPAAVRQQRRQHPCLERRCGDEGLLAATAAPRLQALQQLGRGVGCSGAGVGGAEGQL